MKKLNLSLSAKVFIGVILGVCTGLFFGNRVAWMSVIGDIFIGLLQMTVLPYIMFSLIVNIGRLNVESGRKLIKYGGIFLGLLLSLGIFGLFIFPMAFPNWESGSFYSSNFIMPKSQFDFVKLYIPANIFESLADNIVPAVVLFSIFIGLGVLKIKNREALLKPLDVFTDALNQVNKMVVKITPIGVYAIAAGVVTELSLEDLSRLQGYLVVYLMAVLFFSFVLLPFLLNIITPFSSREVLKKTRGTLLTIFATGKIIVVYPQLIQNIKDIIAAYKKDSETAQNEVDIVMPLAYPFPNLGTFLIFVFVPFAAWYTGSAMGLNDYPLFLSSTLLSSFVAPITGLPFSLDLMDVPKDTFQLFVVSTVLTDRIRVVLGALHLIVLTLLTISASNGWAKFRVKEAIKATLVSGVVLFGVVIGAKSLLQMGMNNIPTNQELLNSFELVNDPQPYVFVKPNQRNPSWRRGNESVLTRIKRRGVLRVGYYENSMPYAFKNDSGELVGFGIDMAHRLAQDLKVTLEFMPLSGEHLATKFKKDYIDIVMSDIFLSSKYAEEMNLSKPYQDVSLAIFVKSDYTGLDSYESANALDTFNIAYFERTEIAREYLANFPNAGMVEIHEYAQLFDSTFIDTNHINGFLTSAERAIDLTVLHANYKVVNPLPFHMNSSLVYPLVRGNKWREYINRWIDFRTQDGTFDKMYDQWIKGQRYKDETQSWSILDDVILK